jgi:Tfp pilus assembly major pilin PilA
MSGFDVAKALVDLGLDADESEKVKEKIEGGDYINLVNALNLKDRWARLRKVDAILSKYNIKLAEGNSMKDSNLETMFSKFREGTLDRSRLGEHLKPMSDSKAPDAQLLAREGFNYFTEIENRSASELLNDWLDENQIEYMTNGSGQFQIKCSDRESAYKVGRAVSGFANKKTVVRDSVDTRATYGIYIKNDDWTTAAHDTTISHKPADECALSIQADSEEDAIEKAQRICGISREEITRVTVREAKKNNAEKREKAAKEKMANIKPRNPDMLALSQRGDKGAHTVNPRKNDPLDRKAKFKSNPADESLSYTVGDRVMVGEQEATIKIPSGPGGTIGVLVDGQLSMVGAGEISRLEESVLGMKSLNPIFRLRELAGMPPGSAFAPEMSPEDDFSDITVDDGETSYDNEISDQGSLDPAMVTSMDAGMNDLGDIGPDFDMGIDPMVDMGGMPGDLPPMGMEAPAVATPTQSDAMSHIEDCLNDIQNKLAEIRLSEYKTLVRKLTDLTQQAQNMGRDYLGERRRK